MQITDVEAMVLDTGRDYPDQAEAAEAHGVRYVSLIKVSTDKGIAGFKADWAKAQAELAAKG